MSHGRSVEPSSLAQKGLLAIAEGCPLLERLVLHCHGRALLRDTIVGVTRALPKLKELRVSSWDLSDSEAQAEKGGGWRGGRAR